MAKKMTVPERIAHFLRLAEDPGSTQHERDVAADQAERLMVKHGIERATLPEQQVKEEIHVGHVFLGGSYEIERLTGLNRVAVALRLQTYQQKNTFGSDQVTGRTGFGRKLFVVAFESDLHDTRQLLHSLDLQSMVAMRMWWNGEGKYRFFATENDKLRARATFVQAFGFGAAERVAETRRVVVEETEAAHAGSALVLVEREQLLKGHVDGMHLGKGRAYQARGDVRAYGAGRAAGYAANTGPGAPRAVGA